VGASGTDGAEPAAGGGSDEAILTNLAFFYAGCSGGVSASRTGEVGTVSLVEVVAYGGGDTGNGTGRGVAVCTGRAGVDRTGGKMVSRAGGGVCSVTRWDLSGGSNTAVGGTS